MKSKYCECPTSNVLNVHRCQNWRTLMIACFQSRLQTTGTVLGDRGRSHCHLYITKIYYPQKLGSNFTRGRLYLQRNVAI